MSDQIPPNDTAHNAQSDPQPDAQPTGEHRSPFPAIRLLYAIGFGIVAWFVFWITLVLALAQFVVVAINGRENEELKQFSLNLIQYLWELLAFIAFVRNDQPFPIGPFPKVS
ncbi:MAG TPA: DUF4389 domain-containing protein [Rhizomicrobium sp.]|jgi:hypothetical protein|nr:DUF4389 domain-containing protein [Rhizomicrobium sp.]